MNDFEKRLKVEGVVGKVQQVSTSRNNTDYKAFDSKAKSAMMDALLKIQPENEDEEIRKLNILKNLDLYMDNFDKNSQTLETERLAEKMRYLGNRF